jgi:hypothetical protein
MAIVRSLAAAAVFTGLAVGAASTAWAGEPTMNGNYTLTSTSPGGESVDTDWTVNSCGVGCLWVKAGAGSSQAHLIGGQWVLDSMDNIKCADNTYVMYAANSHMVWDPVTLQGTNLISYFMPVCGRGAGSTQLNKVSIKQASP